MGIRILITNVVVNSKEIKDKNDINILIVVVIIIIIIKMIIIIIIIIMIIIIK